MKCAIMRKDPPRDGRAYCYVHLAYAPGLRAEKCWAMMPEVVASLRAEERAERRAPGDLRRAWGRRWWT